MIDTTHAGLPVAIEHIRELSLNEIVALYDTGSPDIAATAADLALIPKQLIVVMIDQGFTGSPNANATVRDCENGAWTLQKAVNRAGWNVPRPTLYLGFPDTAQKAFNAGWRGDVWLVNPAHQAPTSPAPVPHGLNVVAEQWDFSNPNFDGSIVFDTTWPRRITPVSVTIPDFSGQPAGEVHNELVKLGLVPTAAPGQRATEIVTSTEPPHGTSVEEGTHVQIVTTIHQTFTAGKYSVDFTGTLRLG